jgi:tol-pal system protein YbgF
MLNAPRYLILACCLQFTSAAVFADDFDELDERLTAVEDRLSESGSGQGGNLLGMVEDFQRMQEELRRLRGEVERLQYESEQARDRQRLMFLDIEKRLAALEAGRQAPAPYTQSSAPAAVLAQPKTPAATGTDSTAPAIVPPPAATSPQTGTAQPGVTTPAEAPTPAVPVPVISEQDAYLQAFELLKQGRYDESIVAFESFLLSFPAGNYADNARYWLAETYYVKKNFPLALAQFQQLLAEHPDSSKLPGALLKIGYIQYEMGNNAEARLALERVRNEFADSSVADLAKQRLERMDREGR